MTDNELGKSVEHDQLKFFLDKAKKYAEMMADANTNVEFVREQLISYEWDSYCKESVPDEYRQYVYLVHNNVYNYETNK